MEKEHNTSTIFFGIFYLREQLHTYLDVFSMHRYNIARHLGHENAALIFENKKHILYRTDRLCWKMKHAPITDTTLFTPIKVPWMAEGHVAHCKEKQSMLRVLLEADRNLIKWCKWFLSEEPGDREASRLFAEIITLTESEIKFFTKNGLMQA